MPKKMAKAVLAAVMPWLLDTCDEIAGVDDVVDVLEVPLVAGPTCLLLSELEFPVTLEKSENELVIYTNCVLFFLFLSFYTLWIVMSMHRALRNLGLDIF